MLCTAGPKWVEGFFVLGTAGSKWVEGSFGALYCGS